MAGSYYNSILRINNQTGTSYTLSIADFNSDTITIMDNASANTVTVPPSVFPIGAQLLVAQEGLGQTSFLAGAGVTINAIGLSISSRYKSVALIQVALNEWDAYGTLDAALYTARTTAFATATNITDTTILNALNTFDLELISNGLDTKIKALYPFVGNTATTQKYNFMDARDLDAAFRLQFNGGWSFSANGALPNGSNAFADTNFNSSLLSLNSSTLLFYTSTNTDGVVIDMGNTDNVSENIILIKNSNSTLLATNSAIGNRIAVSNTDSRGLYLLTRTASNVVKYFKNSSLVNSSTFVSFSTINRNVWISAWNNSNLVYYYSPRNVICSAIADGLNDTESVNLSNAINTFNTTLTRNTY